MTSASRVTLHVGTYTDGESRGIHAVGVDLERRLLEPGRLVAELAHPTFLAWHPGLPVLYAVSETSDIGPERSGGVAAFLADADGGLTSLGVTPTGGASPCHVSVDPAGRRVFVANYHGGSLASFEARGDGRIAAAPRVVSHLGSGRHPVRQTRSHVHAVEVAPGGRFLLACDLGIDTVAVYRIDAAGVSRHVPAGATTRPGAGPRHLAFHPNGRVAFVINELDSTLESFAWDGAEGVLTTRCLRSTLPNHWHGENTAAEVVVHPSGRFVYGSNRGHDSIAAFGTTDSGDLVPLSIVGAGGRTPRHLAFGPSGRVLFVANQDSHAIAVFDVDPRTGLIVDTGVRAAVPSPAFIGVRVTGNRDSPAVESQRSGREADVG